MKIKFDRIFLLKLLIVILTINYMVITIIFNDMTILKYLRDIILVAMLGICVAGSGLTIKRQSIFYALIGVFCIIALLRADSMSLGVACFRRYIFPIGVFIAVTKMRKLAKEREFKDFLKFVLVFFAIISVWGVFQAWVLGDEFLMNLGYPTAYLNQYKRVMLKHSFYFGGLGIQRVVSTISNSNICGLILGSSMLFLISGYKILPFSKKMKITLLIAIAAGYLLTFSRSNFLALLFVAVFIAFKYIPYKKQIFLAGIALVGVGILLLVIQGSDGIIYKLLEWVQDSLNLTDTSVAGRSGIWTEALKAIKDNPMGLGFGHVGSIAIDAKASYYLSCENSYLAMAIDFGIIGALIYVSFMIWIIYHLGCKARRCRAMGNTTAYRICKGGQSVMIYLMIVMFFSNHIYDMEAVAIVYAYAGIALSVGGQNENNSILFATISSYTGK